MDLLNDLGEQHADQIIRGHEAEVALAGVGIEHRFGSDRGLNRQQHLANRFGKLLGVGRGLHLAPHLHQQLVFEIIAQTPEYATGCGLRHVQAFGGTGDVLLFEQYIECHQQIEIQVVETHRACPLLYLFSRYIPVN
ncbi:hypothetical protein D3C87_1663870 [compost metagenome]